MSKEVLFVQFPHPGKEYSISPSEESRRIKDWNYGPHKRKFIKALGQYVKNGNLSLKQDLLFWGEWEPTSRIENTNTTPKCHDIPKWIHSPFLELDSKGNATKWINCPITTNGCISCTSPLNNCPQNTDPFVFSDCFYYSCCKQDQFSKLKNLEKGSIVLFGSKKSDLLGKPYFALDTVFVVSEYKEYSDNNYSILNGYAPNYYNQIMGFAHWASPYKFICYKGANYTNQHNNTYSFVPCKVANGKCEGFPRVKITSKDIKDIRDDLSRSVKYKKSDNLRNKQIWDKLCQITHDQGYELGVRFEYDIITI